MALHVIDGTKDDKDHELIKLAEDALWEEWMNVKFNSIRGRVNCDPDQDDFKYFAMNYQNVTVLIKRLSKSRPHEWVALRGTPKTALKTLKKHIPCPRFEVGQIFTSENEEEKKIAVLAVLKELDSDRYQWRAVLVTKDLNTGLPTFTMNDWAYEALKSTVYLGKSKFQKQDLNWVIKHGAPWKVIEEAWPDSSEYGQGEIDTGDETDQEVIEKIKEQVQEFRDKQKGQLEECRELWEEILEEEKARCEDE